MLVTRTKTHWIRRLLLVELMAGMWVTLKNQFRPHVTVEYPRERTTLKPRFRGLPRLRDHAETEGTLCVACGQCAAACPDNCITVVAKERTVGKGKEPKTFLIDYERCCVCGLCVDACPTKPYSAIYMSQDYELAMNDRKDFMTDKDTLVDGRPHKEYER